MTAQAKGDKEMVTLPFKWANRDFRLRVSWRAQPPLAEPAALRCTESPPRWTALAGTEEDWEMAEESKLELRRE